MLEQGAFDVILLDIHGVGQKESKEQGFGLLKHLRASSPAQVVIAYSNADWGLKYQEFFDMADAKLDKRADYVDFKRVVDQQLQRRFTLDFYLERILKVAGTTVSDSGRLRKVSSEAILSGNLERLERFLSTNISTPDVINILIGIAQIAIGLKSLS